MAATAENVLVGAAIAAGGKQQRLVPSKATFDRPTTGASEANVADGVDHLRVVRTQTVELLTQLEHTSTIEGVVLKHRRITELKERLRDLQERADACCVRIAAAPKYRHPFTTTDGNIAGEICSCQSLLLRAARQITYLQENSVAGPRNFAATGFGSDDLETMRRKRQSDAATEAEMESTRIRAAEALIERNSYIRTHTKKLHCFQIEWITRAVRQLYAEPVSACLKDAENANGEYGVDSPLPEASKALLVAMQAVNAATITDVLHPKLKITSPHVLFQTMLATKEFCDDMVGIIALADEELNLSIDLLAFGFDGVLASFAAFLSPLLLSVAPNTIETCLAGNAGYIGERIFIRKVDVGRCPDHGIRVFSNDDELSSTLNGVSRPQRRETTFLRVRITLRSDPQWIGKKMTSLFVPSGVGYMTVTVHRESAHGKNANLSALCSCAGCVATDCQAGTRRIELIMDFRPSSYFPQFCCLPREIQEIIMESCDGFVAASMSAAGYGFQAHPRLWKLYLHREFGVNLPLDIGLDNLTSRIDVDRRLDLIVDVDAFRKILEHELRRDPSRIQPAAALAPLLYLLLLSSKRQREARNLIGPRSDTTDDMRTHIWELLESSVDLLDNPPSSRMFKKKATAVGSGCAVM